MAVAAVPVLMAGTLALLAGVADPLLIAGIVVAATLLSRVTIRLAPYGEITFAHAPLLVAVLALPFAAATPLAALSRLLADLTARPLPPRPLRRAVLGAVPAAAASVTAFGLTLVLPGGSAAERVVVATAVGLVYAAVELLRGPLDAWASHALTPPAGSVRRAQLLWCLSVAVLVEAARAEPLLLVLGLPLLALGYRSIEARFVAERDARRLAILVGVGHAVGGSLDQTTVFRAVHERIRASLEMDAFFVAMSSPEGETMSFRFLVEQGREVPGMDVPAAGTLAGHCVKTDRPLLIRDPDRDRRRLGLARVAWGSTVERSIMVAPLRIRGRAVGAISAQSVHQGMYDESDLDLLGAIANEAAVAIERADLYEREAALSRRLVALHRVGLELGTERDLGRVIERLAAAALSLLGASQASVYLDSGAKTFDLAALAGEGGPRIPRLGRGDPLIATALVGGVAAVANVERADPPTREACEAVGDQTLVVQPLQAASESVGLVLVSWATEHRLDDGERELLGLLAGIGASAIRSMRLFAELDDAYLATAGTLMSTIQARDGYRQEQQQRIAVDAVALGQRLGLSPERLRDLRYASLFYSLGKIGVPPATLAKPGPLSSEELRLVREHPLLGARIIESIRLLRGVVPLVRHANERWDGTGYPDGLAYQAIPYEARLLQIVLSYHAMIADRPYRAALEVGVALAEVRALSGTRFDPKLADEFVAMIEARGGVEAAQREVQEGAREMAILAEITPQFSTLLDLQQLLDRIVITLERHWSQCRLQIVLLDEPTQELVVRAVAGPAGGLTPGMRRPRGQGIIGWVVQHREPAVVEDVHADVRTIDRFDDTRSVAIVPLIIEDQAIGTLSVSNGRIGAFTRRDLTLLQAIGAQVAAAIEVARLHERLQHAANTDGLTGLHNHRYFYDRLEEELGRAERRHTSLVVAYFDVDDLKKINDEHGHLAGDAVLRTLGRTVLEHVRVDDIPVRYGGDEFTVVMPETTRDEGERVLRRLMDLLDAASVELGDGRTLRMPARSWGLAVFPVDGTTPLELVENADTRAYAHKRSKV